MMPKLLPPTDDVFRTGPEPEIRLLAIGESTIAGVGARDHAHAMTGQIASKLALHLSHPVQIDILAQSGLTITDMHQELVPRLPPMEYDLILMGVGGNDTFRLVPPWIFATKLKQFIDLLQQKYQGSPIVFIHTPPVDEFQAFTPLLKHFLGRQMQLLGKLLNSISRTYQQVFFCQDQISIYDWMDRHQFDGTVEDFFSDGVHPSELTYRFWAEDVFASIVQNNCIAPEIIEQRLQTSKSSDREN